jgi:hypothetical protein
MERWLHVLGHLVTTYYVVVLKSFRAAVESACDGNNHHASTHHHHGVCKCSVERSAGIQCRPPERKITYLFAMLMLSRVLLPVIPMDTRAR